MTKLDQIEQQFNILKELDRKHCNRIQDLIQENKNLHIRIGKLIVALNLAIPDDCGCESSTFNEPEFLCGFHTLIAEAGETEK
jgi:hypothetical protein